MCFRIFIPLTQPTGDVLDLYMREILIGLFFADRLMYDFKWAIHGLLEHLVLVTLILAPNISKNNECHKTKYFLKTIKCTSEVFGSNERYIY